MARDNSITFFPVRLELDQAEQEALLTAMNMAIGDAPFREEFPRERLDDLKKVREKLGDLRCVQHLARQQAAISPKCSAPDVDIYGPNHTFRCKTCGHWHHQYQDRG